MQSRASSLAAQPVTLALALALAAAVAGIEKIKRRRRAQSAAAAAVCAPPCALKPGHRSWIPTLESRGSLALGVTFFRTVPAPLTVYP